MKTTTTYIRLIILTLLSSLILNSCAEYRKMNPPADADKPGGVGTDNSCYLATAANMLAGAGYGDGSTLQDRANDIYGDLTTQFGISNGGWTDVALNWWLGSPNNTWTTNPYTVVTVYGNKSPKLPWNDSNGTKFYANELRRCCFVGLSISWPTAGSSIGSGGHAITAWGDNLSGDMVTINPSEVAVTDSDNDDGGDEQVYIYDLFTAPNPSGANEGNGWYMNYSANHPYLKHIITLCPSDDPTDFTLTQKATGSFVITNNSPDSATDLHYTVSTDVEILSYRTTINHKTKNRPVITESGTPRNSITVDWDLTDNPVPPGSSVTITTEFVLPRWNAMRYSNVHYTYPGSDGKNLHGKKLKNLGWKIETANLPTQSKLPNNVSGGYVIGSFEVAEIHPQNGNQIFYPYRFIHEYNFNQSPEIHLFKLTSDTSIVIRNLNFGHSWNYPEEVELWKYSDWLSSFPEISSDNIEKGISIDWKGRIPYPEGENIYKAIPEKNGRIQKPKNK